MRVKFTIAIAASLLLTSTYSPVHATDKETIWYYTVNKDHKTDIHAEPEEEAEVVAGLPYGTTFAVEDATEGWMKTSVNGYEGWIAEEDAALVSEWKNKYVDTWYYVSNTYAKGIALRKEPDKDGKLITRLPYETEVYVTGMQGEWLKVEYEGMEGWMNKNFLEMKE